jgi:hypothetical protein
VQAKRSVNVAGTVQQVQQQAEAQIRARMDTQRRALATTLNSTGDDAQLANVDLQNALQKQEQALQTLSNIMKMLHDTAMAIIRNMKG